jgi:glycosyltransferase involved in cell wall biosynthesis
MRKIKIYFNYKHIAEPWGGANNFIRALYQALDDSGEFEFADDIEDDYDILFMNQLGMGPARNSQWSKLKEIKEVLVKNKKTKIIVRAVNFKLHSDGINLRSLIHFFRKDIEVIKLLNVSEFNIFQSLYQKRVFRKFGYRGHSDTIIHNGANEIFHYSMDLEKDIKGKINIVSVGSERKSKNHRLIAELSKSDGVNVSYIGRWPKIINNEKVKLLGVLSHDKMAEIYKQSHCFFFPAEKEMCSNALIEALYAGLPVLYLRDSNSIEEVVGKNGLPINIMDLGITIKEFKNKYEQLVKNIEQTKEYYSIKRAVKEYIKIFKYVLT